MMRIVPVPLERHEHNTPSLRYAGRRLFVVTEHCWVTIPNRAGRWGRHAVLVRRGALTDLASIPWFLRWLLSVTSLGVSSVVVHDLMHQTQGVMTVSEPGYGVSFTRTYSCRDSVWVLNALAERDDVPAWKRRAATTGLWLGGWWDWYRVGSRIRRAVGVQRGDGQRRRSAEREAAAAVLKELEP